MNLVCVGISFYNTEKYLDYAIRSVLNQTYTGWELLLVNDGSTDSSLLLARQYEDDARIKIISDGQNKGLVYRLNQLVGLNKCKYFVRMDADDIMHPERLEKQFKYLEQHPKTDVVGSWAYSIDIYNQIYGILKNKIQPDSIEDVFKHVCFIHPSIMGRRNWFIDNPYNSRYVRVEDMELWCRTIEKSNFYNLPEPLLYYREVGVPYLSKYLASMKGVRRLMKENGKSDSFLMYEKLFVNHLKCFIYVLSTALRLQNVLILRRSKTISPLVLIDASCKLSDAIK